MYAATLTANNCTGEIGPNDRGACCHRQTRLSLAKGTDALLVITMLAIATIALLAVFTRTDAIIMFRGLYPIGAYSLIGAACAIGLIDIVAYLACRSRPLQVQANDKMTIDFAQLDVPTGKDKLEDHYSLAPLGLESAGDPIFDPINKVDVNRFKNVVQQWLKAEWFTKLDYPVQQAFCVVLQNIEDENIGAPNLYFSTTDYKKAAYDLFKKALIYIFDKIIVQTEFGATVVLQLNLCQGSNPLAYLFCFSTLLTPFAGEDRIDETVPQLRCKYGLQCCYAEFRRDIISQMAQGDHEIDKTYQLIASIGQEKQIPGYRFLIEHQQKINGLNAKETFDNLHTIGGLIEWLQQKINDKDQKYRYLKKVILDYLAWYFDIQLDIVKDKYGGRKELPEDALLAALEIAKIIVPKSVDEQSSALARVRSKLKKQIQEDHEICFEREENSPISYSRWEDIPLEYLLILSDNCFYDLSDDGPNSDLTYLKENCVKGGHSFKRTPYYTSDWEDFQKKIRHLESLKAETYPHIFGSLRDFILEIVRGKNKQDANLIEPHLVHLCVQNLSLPDYGNYFLGTINLSNEDSHKVAIWIWNGLRAIKFDTGEPTDALKKAAAFYDTMLR